MPAYYFLPKKLMDRFPAAQKAAWWFEGAVFRGFAASMGLLSPQRCAVILRSIFTVFGPLTGKAGKVSKNLSYVVPDVDGETRKKLTRRVMGNLGVATAELIHVDTIWHERAQRIEFVADSATEAILRAGKPIVFVSAHVGAWQLTNLIGAHYGLPISIIYARESNPYLADFFYKLRQGFRVKLVQSTGGIKELLRELQQGNSVGLACDTRMDAGEMIPFFGVPTPTNTVPARLALKLGCPLIPVRAERLKPGRFRITVLPPVSEPDSELSARDQANAMTETVNHIFEEWILDDPGQWMGLKRRWPRESRPVSRAG